MLLLPLTRVLPPYPAGRRVNYYYQRCFSGHHSPPNHYEVLGVRKTATRVEISMAYKRLAKRYHPDMTGGDFTLTEKFRQVTRAYNVLHNPTSRREYDAKLQQVSSGYHHQTYQRQSHNQQQQYGGEEEESMDEKKARWMREARPMSGFQILTLWVFIFAVPFFALRSLHRRAHPHDPDYWNGLSSGGNPYGGLGPPSTDPTDPAARKDLVRAFWNPITERWEWLGEALDPPSANELLGWINSIQPNYFESKLREGKAVMPLRSSTEIKVGYVPLDCTDTPPIVRTRPAGRCEKWDGAKQQAYDAETQEARRMAAYYRQQARGPPGYHGHPGSYPQRYGGPPPPPFGYREPQPEWPSAVKHRVTGEGIIQPYRIVDGHASTTPSGPPAAAPPAGPPPPPPPPSVVF